MIIPFKVKLRAWRLGKKLRQKEAADVLGVNLKTYQGWEYGFFTPSENQCKSCIERKLTEQKL